MSHAAVLSIDLEAAIQAEPLSFTPSLRKGLFILLGLGVLSFAAALVQDPKTAWGVYFINVIFWMGLAAGSVIITAIFQIVRARWSPPVRRIAEANIAFLPVAFLLLLGTYFGKEYLFPWANRPMPGREWWMQPNFVYLRFGALFGALFLLMRYFINLSLRGDIGMLQERSDNRERWTGGVYARLSSGWRGIDQEVAWLQPRLSVLAPVVIIAYAYVFTMFATEMIAGMNEIWYSNMFGGFLFVGNIYLAWATLSLFTIFFAGLRRDYAEVVTTQQLWDLGKLTLGFCMLWGYLFFSQFLIQWYGNLPEETQWLILRTRDFPWKAWGWVTFVMCFVFPFILLLSEDLKKTPQAFATVCLVIFFGLWAERYIIVMPELSPDRIPFSWAEIGMFLGFLGGYALTIECFLRRYPYLPISHPLTQGRANW